MKALIIVGLAGLIAVGCDDKKAPEPVGAGSAPVVATTTTTAAAATTTVATGDIPAEEDFEEKAESTITPTNASAELAKIEKEVGN